MAGGCVAQTGFGTGRRRAHRPCSHRSAEAVALEQELWGGCPESRQSGLNDSSLVWGRTFARQQTRRVPHRASQMAAWGITNF